MHGAARATGWLLLAALLIVSGAAAINEMTEASEARLLAPMPLATVGVSVAPLPNAHPISHGFVGLSVEYPSAFAYFRPGAAALFARLVRQLTPSGPPVIRFGGDTTDWTWWPVRGMSRPPGVTFALTRRWLALTRATARRLGARLILGINLEAGSRAVAGAESRALLAGLGRSLVSGFELGNEPEVYGSIAWYHRRSGLRVMGRRAGYGLRAVAADYRRLGAALPAGVPLAGPSTGSTRWLPRLGSFVASVPRLRMVTVHRYPLRGCHVAAGSPLFPSIAHLLLARTASAPARALAGAVAAAHARGMTLRVDELNSVSCKGATGVSDTFASALWAVDALFHMAAAGVDGVNIHTYPGPYAPFIFTRSGGQTRAYVKPLFYGLLFFTRAAPPGSRLMAAPHSLVGGFRTWATQSTSGVIRVIAINESAHRTLGVAVRSPERVGSARVEYLTAPALDAKTGVAIAGQRFTGTGRLTNSRTTFTVAPRGHRYALVLKPASAALLTLSP